MSTTYAIKSINGPVVTLTDAPDLAMYDKVYVGSERLIGEVVNIDGNRTVIQVYEDTSGLAPGMPLYAGGGPMSLTLGPGLIGGIFDGIGRPLKKIEEQSGPFIRRGANPPTLDQDKKWAVEMLIKEGDTVTGGQIFASMPETRIVVHRSMIPPSVSGKVEWAATSGDYCVTDEMAKIRDDKGNLHSLTLSQVWPIRAERPFKKRRSVEQPLITGQRIIDTLFPIAKGGAAGIPGPFGAGKTITQHQLAKWSDADIIIYVGCGERGNEMTEVLEEFTKLIDPKSGFLLTERTILVANTSNMPVASREASIYTGVTLAAYYRDMGYHVAMMADSTSRWAEALREISGRLEEMPAEEGFPAYLPSRLAEFYEKAGFVDTLSGKEGSVTIIGAVSPQGSDFSEPVTQNTKRFTRTFWALDRQLAYARHFPAINWITSYSEYWEDLEPWYVKRLGSKFIAMRRRIVNLLQEESKLMEIVKLIGSDILPDDQKLIIEITRCIRLGFLQQNAYHETDTYVPLEKQSLMLELILRLYDNAQKLLAKSIPVSQLKATGIFDDVIRVKYDIPNDKPEMFDTYFKKVDDTVNTILSSNAGEAK